MVTFLDSKRKPIYSRLQNCKINQKNKKTHCASKSIMKRYLNLLRNYTSDSVTQKRFGNFGFRPTRVQLPYHSVWRKKVFWTWLEEMFISSNMLGDISLLNDYWDAAMIEVCL